MKTDIGNQHKLNDVPNENYEKFNQFIFSNDLKITGKLLHRFQHFLNVKHLPGDIVEVGVFKGSGVASFLKFIEVFCPNSNKKVLGFDIFDVDKAQTILEKDSELDKLGMNDVHNRVNSNQLTLNHVRQSLENVGIDKFKLISGDVEDSMPLFLKENPGFRASLIYMDVDIDRPTYTSLNHLWDRLLPGGVVIFDEYEYHTFSESNGVDKFLKERNIPYTIKSTDWVAPSAYIYKNQL